MVELMITIDPRLFKSSIRSKLEKPSIEPRHEISDLDKDMIAEAAASDAKRQFNLLLHLSVIIGSFMILGCTALGLFMQVLISARLQS